MIHLITLQEMSNLTLLRFAIYFYFGIIFIIYQVLNEKNT